MQNLIRLDRYSHLRRKVIWMAGPSTDALVSSGKIAGPIISLINNRNIPLSTTGAGVLAVLVPTDGKTEEDIWWEFKNLDLKRPTAEHAIRFVSQSASAENEYRRSTLVFPSDPPVSFGVTPPAPSWFVLSGPGNSRKKPELRLFMVPRQNWPEGSYFVGIVS